MEAGETTLENVIQVLEADYGFLFSYKVEDVQNFKVVPPKKKESIEVFLTTILQDTPLEFEIVQTNYILLKRKADAENLSKNSTDNSENVRTICGEIVDEMTQEPLPFANVFFAKNQLGTSTSEDGSFQISAAFQDNDTVVISYVGFQPKKVLAQDLIQQPCARLELKYFEFSNDFIVITDYLTDGISLNDNSSVTLLQPNKIKALPGQIEPDLLKTLQFLPGISSPEGNAGSLCIRGGTPDQNLILWEEIPVYHSAHYFGNLSAFNPYIINQAAVYRGGFNAEYGGRISGIIDLKSGEPLDGKSEFDIGANLVNVYANGKVSFLKNKASIVFSVRRSFSELWDSPTFRSIKQRVHRGVLFQTPDIRKLPENIDIEDDFYFFDSNVKASFEISKKDEISIAGFFGQNDFQSMLFNKLQKQEQADSLVLENSGLSVTWNRKWNSNFSSKLVGLVSDYQYEYDYKLLSSEQQIKEKAGIKKSRINEQQIHFSNRYQTPRNHALKFGYQLLRYDVAFQITKQNRENSQVNENKIYKSDVHVAYASFDSAPEKKLGMDIGLRASFLESENRTYLEPRLKFWYKISDDLNLNFTTGKYYQFLSQLQQIEGDQSSIETPVWVLAGEKEVPILDATQHQVGLVFRKKSWLVDVQAYHKNIDGLTSLATGFDEELSGEFHLGKAKIRGIDFLVKKRWTNFSSWLSYSLSKVNHQFDTFFDTDFDAPNDQPHHFNWVNAWNFKNIELSLGWKISSGTPYSLLENFRIQTNGGMMERRNIQPVIKEFNGERLPAIHQLDASVLYHFYPKKKGKWKGEIGLSLFNIYNQANRYQRGFFMDFRPNEDPQLAYTDKLDLGFTPNFMLRWSW